MKQTLDLSPLAPDYEIVGELDDAEGSTTYIATRKGDGTKRRDDQTSVLITVVTTPEGDEANALSHLAADTRLLVHTPHRRLLPVLDGRWLGEDAFAVVTQRTTDPSLSQRLATGETFTNPRIAAILREVNGLLEWAREAKIVHRAISASRLYLEPKTDRVRVSFAIAPIQRLHRTDAQDDARTIARLAMAMLTGEEDPRAYEGRTLAELRPDLPERLGEAAAALLDEKNTGAVPDVAAFLALIGMADPVAAGEAERERVRADILEEQRAEREKLAAERAEFERSMAEQKAAFERTMTEERARFDRTMELERERLAKERAELERAVTAERDTLQRAAASERDKLAATRASLERTVAEQRAELERAAARDRQQIDALREELRRAGEREVEKKRQVALEDIDVDAENELERAELATPAFLAPVLAPIEPLAFDDTVLMRDDAIEFAPLPDEEPAPEQEVAAVAADASRAPGGRRKWILSGSAAAVLALIGITASVLANRQPSTPAARPVTRQSAAAVVVPTPVAARPVPTPVAPAPAPALPLDSASSRTAARWLDSLKEEHPVELPRVTRVVREPVVDRSEDRPVERPAERTERPATQRPPVTTSPFFIPGSSTPAPVVPPPVTPTRPDTTTTVPPR